ncbi:hypothetical protein AVEN_31199-1 [Araneus ventricosus]|uniref:Uncharacterized protein n=1 Tax=Araneus ventricosus TaxID=182803 RepID=A0A4Y2PVX2_ARAVE|nr:hypothetical protein AVEN_31199-1 [Araneus ventricosus]
MRCSPLLHAEFFGIHFYKFKIPPPGPPKTPFGPFMLQPNNCWLMPGQRHLSKLWVVHRKTSSAFLTSIEEGKFGTEISSSSETDSSISWFDITLEFMMSVAISESDFSPDVCKLSSIDTYRKKVSSIPSSSLMIISSVKLKPHKFSAASAMFSPHFLKQFDIVLDETMSHALRIVCMESKIESDF